MIDISFDLLKELLVPNKIIVERIGAVVYSSAAEKLCLRHFDMKKIKEAPYRINDFTPSSYVVQTTNLNNGQKDDRMRK